jgi:hypothetical protein
VVTQEFEGTADPDTGWLLLRAAVVGAGSILEDEQKHRVLRIGEGRVDLLLPMGEDGVLAVAAVPMTETPDFDRQELRMPASAIREAERLIETMARLLALEHRSSHRVSSPSPCVGLLSTGTAMAKLEGLSVRPASRTTEMWAVGRAGLFDDTHRRGGLVRELADRDDGVFLLSEVLNTESPLGRFIQLWRFFERAFNRGHAEAHGKLVSFLVGKTRHGFDEEEVGSWLEDRNPAIHARRAEGLVLDTDVQPHVGRMLEAAYDVLLNKAEWRSPSVSRRDLWTPIAGTSGRRGVFLTQNQGGHTNARLFDFLGAYPAYLRGSNQAYLPNAAWVMHEEDSLRVAICGSWIWPPTAEAAPPK